MRNTLDINEELPTKDDTCHDRTTHSCLGLVLSGSYRHWFDHFVSLFQGLTLQISSVNPFHDHPENVIMQEAGMEFDDIGASQTLEQPHLENRPNIRGGYSSR